MRIERITYFAILLQLGVFVNAHPAWHTEVVDDTGDVGYSPSLAIDSNDNPHISYEDGPDAYDLKYCFHDSTGWHFEIIDTAGIVGMYSSITLDSSDYPHISHYDFTNDDLEYAYKDGSGWHHESFSTTSGAMFTDIALDATETPHFSYVDMTDGLMYARFDNPGWTAEPIYLNVWYSSIALDSNSYPHITTANWDNDDLIYAYMNTGGWHIETIDTEGDAGFVSIALDDYDYPHISYFDNSPEDLKYAYKNGSGWHIEVVDEDGFVGWHTDIALDSSGYPHISYFDSSDLSLNYAYKYNNGWHIETVHSNISIGNTSIALDSNDNPSIAYQDMDNWELWYAYFDSAGIEDEHNTPVGYYLSPPHPNPNDGNATISYVLPKTCRVSLELFDIKGRKIATLDEGQRQPGEYTVEANGLTSGLYLYKLTAGEFVDVIRMVVR